MNVKWEDVKADYARKDAEIAELKEALKGLLWALSDDNHEIPLSCISAANKALTKD